MDRKSQLTIKDVAELLGVAPSSVSRALNDHPSVSPRMKTRVLRAAEQLGYHPDFLAQSLRRGATYTVGFVIRDISIPLFGGIVKGAVQELDRHGYSSLLMNSLRDPSLEAKHIGVLRRRRVDGLILSLQSEHSQDTNEVLHHLGTPTVLLDRELPGISVDAVFHDHASGVRDAGRSLLRDGHRRVALILERTDTRASRERIRGLTTAYAAEGLSSEGLQVIEIAGSHPEAGIAATFSLLERSLPPTAIIAGDAQLGIGLLTALGQRGLRHGHDISVVICDDIELLTLMTPPVSTVQRDGEQMGALAAQVLMWRISNPSAPRRVELLPTAFVDRGSICKPLTRSASR